jgi:hypothetical protein
MYLFRSIQVFHQDLLQIPYLFHASDLSNNNFKTSLLSASLNKANSIRSHAEPDRYEIHVSRL